MKYKSIGIHLSMLFIFASMSLRFLKYIWVIYAAIVFFISLLLAFPVYSLYFLLFPKEKADKKIYPISRLWGKMLSILFFVRIKKHYLAKPNKKDQYIYIANHRSMLDIPLTATLIPSHFRFLAKNSLVKVPLMGFIVKGICITVDRQSLKDKNLSFLKMKETLKNGSSVLIFPEGTRSRKDQVLNSFQNGAFKLSKESQVPIVMITLWNTSNILTKHKFWEMKPGTIHCIISKPMDASKPLEELKEEAYQSILKNIESFEKRN